MRTRRLCELALAAALLAGCGDEPETAAPSTELTVTVNGKSRTVTDAGGLTAKDFAPTPPDQACTEIYGGDAKATVTGRLDGERIDAEFSLVNGCEIARWDDAEAVLGPKP